MAVGKHRSNKRSSSNSYASTVTTIVFVSVCILGAWMLTSNSVISPQKTTTRIDTTTDDSSTSNERHSANLPRKIPTDSAAFEDNPGDLPIDAVKHDEDPMTQDDPDPIKDSEMDKKEDDNQGGGSTETEPEPEPETTNNVVEENAETVNDSDAGKQEAEEQEAAKLEQEMSATSMSVVKENPLGLQGKVSVKEEEQQKGQEIQLSEESTVTRSQNIDEITDRKSTGMDEEHQQSKEKLEDNHFDKQTETGGGDNQGNSDNNPETHISEEEQEKRMENQQQQEEERSQQGETSEDQVQHDEEAPIESHSIATETKAQVERQEAQEVSKQMEQAKIETTPITKSKKDFTRGNMYGESSTGIPKESKESQKGWSTQADQSVNQKERRQGSSGSGSGGDTQRVDGGFEWKLCNVTAGTDYIPCLDNEKAISKLHSRNHYEHRERHCPEEGPTCLVPFPAGYKPPIPWPQSRDKIWFHNVPHKSLADVKGHQNWVKVTGEFLTFPGGGTQFIHGALHYIDFVQQAVPEIAWGKRTRVILDIGCGVASFGGYLFDRDVLAMSFAPKDEHEAQIQFALERGIPAISAVMGTQRLPFPSRVFDLVHCARCRVPWHREGGTLLLELNRLLRPGGYFAWSATPVYQTLEEDVQIWKEMSALTVAMCWELVTIKKDKLNSVGVAIYHKPESNECYNERKKQEPPMCKPDDDPNAAWYVPLQACMHKLPVEEKERGSQWPEEWPQRVQTPPYWLNKSQMGIYGKPAPDDFKADYEHWKWVVSKSYMSGLGISWTSVRNVMDMRAVYGGFAAALKDLKLWVLNVVNVDSPDTLPIIYERGLFGIYHDWCESFSTYPRTYDLLHADHLFSKLKKRCKLTPVMAEVDRITRPGGKLIVRDEPSTIGQVEILLKSLHWEIRFKNQEGILSAEKSTWRPDTYAKPS